MGATRRNLQARPKILKKLLKHQINQSERKISQKKIYLVSQKFKGAKNSYEDLQAQPKILKKNIKH
jgi:hypothetical protein